MIVSQDPLRRTKVISMNLVMAWVNFRSPVTIILLARMNVYSLYLFVTNKQSLFKYQMKI